MADNKAAKTAETKTRKRRSKNTPTYNYVHDLAHLLSMEDRATLIKALKISVNAEVSDLQTLANKASEIAKEI